MAVQGSQSDTAYVEIFTLTAGHSNTVNYLSFSPDGSHIASGGDDYALIIWNAMNGRLLYRLLFKAPVGCVIWHPIHPETIIAGCDNGYIFQLHDFNLNTSEQHEIHLGARSTVICLDYDASHKYLAVGMGDEVHITREVERNKYSGCKKLPPPPDARGGSDEVDARVRPVSVHFLNNGQHLLVSYLNHGVVCWSTEATNQLWCIPPPDKTPEIGGSALSPDQRHLVVYNMASGVARYAVGTKGSKLRQFYKLDKPARSKLKVQVSFLHDGRAITCGTTNGQVCIWNVKSGEHFQLLTHAGDVVQAIAAAQRGDTSYVATASADKGQQTYIKIWRAKIKRARTNPVLEDTVAMLVQTLTLDRIEVDDGVSLGIVIATTTIICFVFAWLCTLLPWKWIVSVVTQISFVMGAILQKNFVSACRMLKQAGEVCYATLYRCGQQVGWHIRSAALSFLFPEGNLQPLAL